MWWYRTETHIIYFCNIKTVEVMTIIGYEI